VAGQVCLKLIRESLIDEILKKACRSRIIRLGPSRTHAFV
jgi:hypothetical protein